MEKGFFQEAAKQAEAALQETTRYVLESSGKMTAKEAFDVTPEKNSGNATKVYATGDTTC